MHPLINQNTIPYLSVDSTNINYLENKALYYVP